MAASSMSAPSARSGHPATRAAGRLLLARVLLVGLPGIAIAAALAFPPPDSAADVRAAVSGPEGSVAATSSPSGAPLVLEVPWDGAVVVGTTLEIRGTVSVPLGRIHAEVTNGLAVLGAADTRIDGPGIFRMTLPLAASGSIGRARLAIWTTGEWRGVLLASRDITVCAYCA